MTTVQSNRSAGNGPTRQVVTFEVSGEELAVPILSVREIIRWVQPTTIPCSGPGIEGIINLRGQIIPVVRMDARLELQPTAEQGDKDDERIIVLDIGQSQVGFLVSKVRQVLKIDEASISPAPQLGSRTSDFLDGVAKLEDRLVLLVDPRKLTSDSIEEATRFAEHSGPELAAA